MPEMPKRRTDADGGRPLAEVSVPLNSPVRDVGPIEGGYRYLAEAHERALAWPITDFPSRQYDGLQVDTETGQFLHRGLVPGWIVEGAARTDPGDLALAWLAVRPAEDQTDPAARVTSRLLRSIPVTVLLNEVRQALLLSDAARRAAFLAQEGRASERPALDFEARTGGRRRLDDRRKQALLRRVAIAYLEEDGQPGVYARLAKRFRRDQEAIKALVRAARTDGWLSGATHGVRGADPGSRLLRDEKFAQGGKG